MPKSHEFERGDEVIYVGKGHKVWPGWYPEEGTPGTILDYDNLGIAYVRWQKGSTSLEDEWHCVGTDLRLNSNNCC